MKLPPSTMMGPLHATELVTSVIGVPSSPSVVFVPMSITLSMTMPLLPIADALATISRLVAMPSSLGSVREALHTRISGAAISSIAASAPPIATNGARAARIVSFRVLIRNILQFPVGRIHAFRLVDTSPPCGSFPGGKRPPPARERAAGGEMSRPAKT